MKKIIKTLTLLTAIMMMLAACGSKDYKAALEKAYDHLEIQAYEEAYDDFSKAMEHKKTDQAKKGQETAKIMLEAWQAFDEGDWEDAIDGAETIIEDESDDQAITIVLDDAKQLKEEAEELAALEDELNEKLAQADSLASEAKYEEAKEILEEIILTKTDHPVILAIIEQAKEQLADIEEILEKENTDGSDESADDDEDTNTNNNDDDANNEDDNDDSNNDDDNTNDNDTDQNGSTNEGLSADEAASILKNALQLPDNVVVNIDHEDGPYYIIQVYEIVGSGDDSHTATWGWYKMHKVTGEWEQTI